MKRWIQERNQKEKSALQARRHRHKSLGDDTNSKNKKQAVKVSKIS